MPRVNCSTFESRRVDRARLTRRDIGGAMTILRVTDASTRGEIEAAIVELRAKVERMPAHWADRRQVVADEIDSLVDLWLERTD